MAGFEADAWFGLLPPAGTPAAAIERVNAEVQRALQVSEIRQPFEALGCEPAGGTAAAFGAYFKAEIDKWGKVIRSAGVRLERSAARAVVCRLRRRRGLSRGAWRPRRALRSDRRPHP